MKHKIESLGAGSQKWDIFERYGRNYTTCLTNTLHLPTLYINRSPFKDDPFLPLPWI